jgi:Uncharacterised nucleotidyltransferase
LPDVSSVPVVAKNEWAFVCACVSPACPASQLQTYLAQELDWSAVLDFTENHGVQGLVATRFEEIGFSGVPALIRKQLQSRMRAQHIFTLSMTAELFRILESFAEGGISTALVKGPVISLLAFNDPAVRNYVDLDLLLHHRDIQNATRLMLKMGFASDIPESAIRAGKIPGEYLFRRPGTQRIIELHTEHTFRYYPRPMRIDELFARCEKRPLDGREVPALSLEDELVLNCIHGAKHFWEKLMWVSDIAWLLAAHPEIDWHQAQRAAASVGAERMLRVGVQLQSMLLQTAIPSTLVAEIARDSAGAALCGEIQTWLPYAGTAPPPLFSRAMFRLKMGGGGLTGAAYLFRLALSPTQEDWEQGAEERTPRLLESLKRPLRLFRKYGSND